MDLKFKDNSKLRLGYTQVEYIESTGTQYIDTGIKLNQDSRVVLEFNDLNSPISFIFGARNSADSAQFGYINGVELNQGARYGSINTRLAVTHNAKLTLDANKNVWTLSNGNNITLGSQTFTCNYNCFLFGINNYGTSILTPLRIYSCKIYNNNVLVRDFIPCKDIGVVCLYDTISETFFYNQGTGDFIAGPGFSNNILLKTTTLYHKNTPNIDGLQLLNGILSTQKTSGNVVLERIRVDIGNVSGSISELMQYSSMTGFNDAGEEQTKPRLVGTWTINDWYTQEQLAAAQSAFDGLTIIEDPNYLINFDELAVQVLDDTKPNYNPAIAIILQRKNLGITMDAPVVAGQTGRWFLLKSNGLTYPSLAFQGVTNSVTDANGIVSKNTALTYQLKSFHEFQYFKGITYFDAESGFRDCSLLKSFTTSGNLSVYKNMTITNAHGNMVLYLKEINPDVAFDAPAYKDRRAFVDESGSNLSDRFIFCAYKDRYKDFLAKEIFINRRPNYKTNVERFKTYYEYCAPQIQYQDGLVTINVERQSDIYYTLDGSTPTTHSNKYTEPFTWNGTGVIKAMAIDTTNVIGDIAYADNFYATDVETPVISYNTTTKQIIITSTTPDTTIHYTLDNTHPSLESNIYSVPIDATELGDIVKVRCFAVKDGMNDSKVVGKICVMDDTLWGTDGDTSSFAVQCMNSTKPNYNPAVCIILDYYNTLTDKCYNRGGSYLSKENATTINLEHSWFVSKVTVTDTTGIVGSDTTATYDFESFDELKYFTSLTSLPSFSDSTKLSSIAIPTTVTILGLSTLSNTNISGRFVVPSQVTEFGAFGRDSGNNSNCKVTEIVFEGNNITTIPQWAFRGVNSITSPLIIPDSVTNFGSHSFYHSRFTAALILPAHITNIGYALGNPGGGWTSIYQYVWLKMSTPPSYGAITGSFKIYVGDGSSADHDDAILADYVAASGWSSFVSRLDTWYNYLHPTT